MISTCFSFSFLDFWRFFPPFSYTHFPASSRLFAGKCARTLIVCDFLYVGPIFAKFLHINCWNHRLVVGQCYENFFLSFGYVGVQNWQFKPICPGDRSWIHTEIETKNIQQKKKIRWAPWKNLSISYTAFWPRN